MLSNSDIQKLLTVLVSKEDLKNLATKEDLREVEDRLNNRIDGVEGRLNNRIDGVEGKLGGVKTELKDLNEKVDQIVEFMQILDDSTDKRLKRVEKHLNLPLLPV